jgi:hypothetical protein
VGGRHGSLPCPHAGAPESTTGNETRDYGFESGSSSVQAEFRALPRFDHMDVRYRFLPVSNLKKIITVPTLLVLSVFLVLKKSVKVF